MAEFFPSHKRSLIFAVTAMAVAAIAVILLFLTVPDPGPCLRIRDADTGRTRARLVLREGDPFCVEFVHSVNRTPYYDLYEIRDGRIVMIGIVYYSFGAGVPEVLDPEWTLTMLPDGGMQVTGMALVPEEIIYRVGTVFDHFLITDAQTVNLRELCGRNSRVQLVYG